MSSNNHVDNQSISEPPSGSSSKHRMVKHVSTACDACKKSRTKCDGVIPCRTCRSKNVLCTIDQSQDGRRDRKRSLEQLHAKADALETLLDSFRALDDDSVREVLTFVRNGSSTDEIVKRLRVAQSQSHNSNLKVTRTVLDIPALVDEPPVRVPAKPWTQITDDDLAVSHLISVYFTWQNHGYPSVDQDTFVRHMSLGNETSQFCSPFLVTCMLLVACVYTDHPLAFASADDRSTRGLHFLDEATRLWALEQGTVSLTNLQALPSFISAVVVLGKDRIGIDLANRCVQSGSDLAREVRKGLKRGQKEFSTEEFQQSYMLARWAAFCVETEVAIAWSKPLDLRKPSKEYIYTMEDPIRPSIWRPYPKAGPEIEYYPMAIAAARFKLFAIAADLQKVLLSGTPDESPLPGSMFMEDSTKLAQLHQAQEQLSEWLKTLPREVQLPASQSSAPAGPLLDLHLAYNGFQVLTASLILRVVDITREENRLAAEMVTSACLTMADLLQWVQKSIGHEYFSIYVPHAASLSAYNLLPYLDRPELSGAFHTMIFTLSATRDRWTLAHGIVRMLWIEVQQRNLTGTLNESTLDLFKLSAIDTWGPQDHRLFEKCTYPNYAAIKERGSLLAEMGELLDEYARLHVDESTFDQKKS